MNDFIVEFDAFVRTSSNGIDFYRYDKQKAHHFINWSLFLFKIEDVIAHPENYLIGDSLTVVVKVRSSKQYLILIILSNEFFADSTDQDSSVKSNNFVRSNI